MPLTIDSLNSAIRDCDIEKIEECLLGGVDVNSPDDEGYYPLDYLGKINIPKQDTSEPQNDKETSETESDDNDDESSDDESSDDESSDDESHDIESDNKALEVLNVLMPHKPNFFLKNKDGEYLLGALLRRKSHKIVELIINYLDADKDLVELLLGNGQDSDETSSEPLLLFSDSNADDAADIGSSDMPLFFYIILYGQKEDIEVFIKCARQKSSDIPMLLGKKYKGSDPLIFSILHRKFDIMSLLLELGANPNAVDGNNVSAFQLLVFKNNLPSVKVFLKFNPDVDHVDNFGQNCLHQIAGVGASKVMNVVLPRMSVQAYNHRSQLGKTPLYIALQKIIEIERDFFGDRYSQMGSNDADDECEWIDKKEESRVIPFARIVKKLLVKWVDTSDSKDWSALKLARTIKTFGSIKRCVVSQRIYFESKKDVLSRFEDGEPGEFQKAFEKYMNVKLRQLLYHEKDLDDARGELIKHLKKIETAKFVEGKIILIYETCKALVTDKLDFEVYFTPRNSDGFVGEPYEDYFYTFLDGEIYQLTKIPDEPLYYLMTTLVYEAMRHDWDDPVCKLHHDLIAKLEPKYKNFTLEQFKKEIEKIEKKEKDFFGENISDDSDSEQEVEYQIIPQRQRHLRTAYSQTLFKRAQPAKLYAVETDALLLSGKPKYDTTERQTIVRDVDIDLDVQRDLDRLNDYALCDELDSETIKTIDTAFYVAQYRGITYRIDEWNKPSRKSHREAREENFPLFSRAVLDKAGYKSYGAFFNRRTNDANSTEEVIGIAEKLHEQLWKLTLSGPVKLRLIGEESYLFPNALLALQDLYTKAYDKFHDFLEAASKKLIDDEVPVDTLEDAICLSMGEYNPLVSTADVPDHALRYAYGEKYYDGHKEQRLRPRWRRNGRAERPYSGKVYISLHDPLELLVKAHHVVSLNNKGYLNIDIQKGAEKETSFFAYIPEGKVVSQHVAKFPSFHGDYKEIYLEKYGLTKELYDQFKQKITAYAPHTPKAKHFKDILTQHLISFHEVALIEEAKIAAENSGGVLIYRNDRGGFSLLPSRGSDASVNVPQKRKASAIGAKDLLMKKRGDRKVAAVPASSFLPSLVSRFSIFSYQQPDGSLVKSLTKLLDIDADEIKQLRDENPDDEHFLRLVAEQNNAIILIHDAQEDGEVKKINAESGVTEINLYYMGGGQYAALRPKPPTAVESHDDDNDAFQLDAS
jgi:ankyrin repeat protein